MPILRRNLLTAAAATYVQVALGTNVQLSVTAWDGSHL